MSIRLLLVRHGETADNASKVFQGRRGRGLNERGVAQAARLAERLRGAKIARVITSDLERAIETARHVATIAGREIELEPELREVDVGAWTGLSYAEVEARFPEEWAAWRDGVDLRRGGGETYAELGARIARAIDRIARTSETSDVVVVSHGAALRTFVCRVLGISVSSRSLGAMTNTAVTTVEHDGTTARLVSFNDASHLEPSLRCVSS